MANSSAHLQIKSAQSAAHSTHDTHEKIRVTVQPKEKTTKTVKIILGLLSAGVLLALTVAVVAVVINQQHVTELKKNHRLEVMIHELQTMLAKSTETDLPQPPPSGASISTSPVTMPAETRVSTTSATTITHPGLTSCDAIQMSNSSAPNGTYTIHPGGHGSGRRVWCDMSMDGGGWTVFQRRLNGSVDFNQTWNMYERGFGQPESEMWLGNEDLHRLTTVQPSELRVDLSDWEGIFGYAKYSTFSVGNASTKYTLHVGGYHGNIGDALSYHNSQPFTTKDRDNDGRSSSNCATSAGGGGGWWYRNCHDANLNGRYVQGGLYTPGVMWYSWRGHRIDYSYRAAAMMVRPSN